MRITEAEIEAALQYGVDTRGRKIFLHGDVDEDTIGISIRGLYLLDTIQPAKIELYVASYGGMLDDAFALHDVTRTIKSPVHTVALGKCQSAAPMIVASGQRGHRYATENCQFMLHDAKLDGDGSPESPHNLISHAEATKDSMERYARMLSRYTKKPLRHWRKVLGSQTDVFFDAHQALEWGLVDQVWSEK